MTELGDIRQVPLREAWPHEAQDFTPWLAREENIKKLGDAIGMELELKGVEVPVGPYSADLLAENEAGMVVIENQLEKTNHDHLGKAITYASVLGATTVVWIAQTFTDEHKKALDWLNDHSTEEVGFYGVQVELWSIDNSRPAARFNVLSRPAGIVRQASVSKANAELTDAKKLQLRWWQAVSQRLLSKGVLSSAREPKPRYWYDIALGRTGFHLSSVANTWDKRIGIRVYMRASHGGAEALRQLREQKSQIEAEIGQTLLWDANPDAADKTIVLHRSIDFDDEDSWPGHVEWLVDQISKFREVFGPRVKLLQLDSDAEDDHEAEA